jgi:GNAT superfamily N-acetyltransferase
MTVREIPQQETHIAAATLLELRPHHKTLEAMTKQIDKQRAGGYRVVASMEGDEAAAVAGFRVHENTAWGRHLYVDDLVTHPEHTRKGHADALFAWLDEEAKKQDCGEFHLDSGVAESREAAHRFYFNHGLRITSYHFARSIDR